jgi:hypothetical protein
MPTETERLLHELAQQMRGLRSEMEFIRNELRSMAGGLAVVVSQSRDNKKKLPGLPTSSRAWTTDCANLNQPGN